MRNTQTLPKNMEQVKREFSKVKNMFFAKRKQVTKEAEATWENDVKENTLENYALFWMLMQEFYAYLNTQEAEITETLLARLEKEGKQEVLFPEYGVKVVWDSEAQWFYKFDMTNKDWKEYDKKCNERFIKR